MADHTIEVPGAVPILVEFAPRPGLQQVSLSPSDMARRSAEALDSAMNTVQYMAQRLQASIAALAAPPSTVELEFGVKLDAEAGAFIAKASVEAGLTVKLSWERSAGATRP